MPEKAESEELCLHVCGLRQKRDVLRMYQLSFVEQATARLLFPA